MKLFDRLLGRRPDPCACWGVCGLPLPDFDLSENRFGALGFGDDLDAASFLGRPDRLKWTQDGYCELLYASAGFQLDFDAGRLAYAAFFIGPDEHQPDHPSLAFSQPRLNDLGAGLIQLVSEMRRENLARLLGEPAGEDIDADETVLRYHRGGIVMEFELTGGSGRLKRWNLYPESTCPR